MRDDGSTPSKFYNQEGNIVMADNQSGDFDISLTSILLFFDEKIQAINYTFNNIAARIFMLYNYSPSYHNFMPQKRAGIKTGSFPGMILISEGYASIFL